MIQLIADSTCDLSPELVERYHIDILPLCVNLGADARTDGVDITQGEIFEWSDRTKETPKTSVFPVDKAKKKFRPYLERGDELICFSISGQMSASGQVMRMAVEELHAADRIHVVDAENLSTGIGLLILRAADLIAEGRSAEEIVREIEATRPLVRASFVVDTLTYLHRGGRCSGVTALMGSVLKIHPKIVVEHGAMRPDAKYRGPMHRIIGHYVEDLLPDMRNARPDRVFITHTCTDEALAAEAVKTVKETGIFAEVLETRAGCVVSSHCGPNTLGVLFIAKE